MSSTTPTKFLCAFWLKWILFLINVIIQLTHYTMEENFFFVGIILLAKFLFCFTYKIAIIQYNLCYISTFFAENWILFENISITVVRQK